MKILLILSIILDMIPGGSAYMKQLQPRDSILIADWMEYGFEISDPSKVGGFALPDVSKVFNDTLVLVRDWSIDSVLVKKKLSGIKGSIVLAPFQAGKYILPDIPVLVEGLDGKADTVVYKGMEVEVKTIPIDTASYVIKDIKEQIGYPLTFAEVAPYIGGALGLGGLIVLFILVILPLLRKGKGGVEVHRDPPHIVALRELDKYRSNKFWAPDKQKQFYSGITDALKVYMGERYSIDAPEMTTAEVFDALKEVGNIEKPMLDSLQDLFETADFVKFAKAVIEDEKNALALPLAIKFVTTTYQSDIAGQEEAQEQ